MTDSSYIDGYLYYVQEVYPLAAETLAQVEQILANTSWDEPQSALDLNNLAVAALVEAETADDLTLRGVYLDMALEALGDSSQEHPLCAAHLALLQVMIGETGKALQSTFSTFINTLQFAYSAEEQENLGLVYLPPVLKESINDRSHLLTHLFQSKNSSAQALVLLVEVMWRSQLAFYSPVGLRFLQLAAQLQPNSASINLKLGISSWLNQQCEGLLYLQRAGKLAPDNATVLHALVLAYKELNQPETANLWLKHAASYGSENLRSPEWSWVELESRTPFTYVPFENNLKLAVEPSFRSIVTSVLLAEGDWFEAEMEFWRSQLQLGMTVIDVGANVGVYTFSAAQKVGATGRVLAVEPFSGCVRCMEETCRVNQLDWVKVCTGAASDRNGTIRLVLHSASEFNEVITDESRPLQPGMFEEVPCFMLDSLIEQEKITKVDWLKIDAEGHEMQVLKGCDRLLRNFKPSILYENVAGAKANNRPVAEFLIAQGYNLFYYRPYVQELIPVSLNQTFTNKLNIIAIPQISNLTSS
ncbi:FkbM family methyltransferase [Leptolyngbya sp. FACHB-541]|uniref:FkbM family methyltransferase n=1 Tax=Leptolyngbya sp. FACHB-541 TaxID=2692810 RepID=UPI0016832B49|nr:FkbM family methyltransferase [Leptolyngbya sp. FACHB-541]MBD1996776.1 FkbM family methyltransferase [Leptolyngbya sp. FACHB-541]